MLDEPYDGKIAKWRKDGAARQRRFKEHQRALGRQRAEYWVTEHERRALEALLSELRSSS